MTEPVVTIKFTQAEVEKLMIALRFLKSVPVPVNASWKKPYNQLLKDLQKISDDIDAAKKIKSEEEASENFRESFQTPIKCEPCED